MVLFGCLRRIQRPGRDTFLLKFVDLVLDEREKGRDDDRDAVFAAAGLGVKLFECERGYLELVQHRHVRRGMNGPLGTYLEAKRLACARWEHDQCIVTVQDALDHLSLLIPERSVPEPFLENLVQDDQPLCFVLLKGVSRIESTGPLVKWTGETP